MTRQLRLLTSAAAPPPEVAAAALESDFVVILAALLCAVICVVGLLAVSRCAWLRRAAPNPHISGGAAANKGLKKKVLQNLPKFTFESAAAPPKMTSECAICLSEFAEGEEIRALPQCRHVFHVTCIDTWLTSHSSCPSCRQVLVVARCHKCGNFPAIPEAQPKNPPAVATSASATCSRNASNTNDSSNSNCNSNSSDFLP